MRTRETHRAYSLYGVRLKSAVPLAGLRVHGPGRRVITLFEGSAALFSRARRQAELSARDWFQHARLADGSDYLQWSGLFEFLVSVDGRRIAYGRFNGASAESLQTYLLAQVLSFALVKRGIEPLHATSVVIDGQAVAFLADCGYGKSSLGAAFLQVGCPLLTDDLLVLKEQGDRFIACPGPPRIKLFPAMARRLLARPGNAIPMNNGTSKLVIALGENETVSPKGTFPLKAIYVLTPPASARGSNITIRPLSPRRVFFELIKNTFNPLIVEPERLERQFDLASRLAARVPVRSLSYPRNFRRISEVRDSILRELAE
jgi:hypothetical protein